MQQVKEAIALLRDAGTFTTFSYRTPEFEIEIELQKKIDLRISEFEKKIDSLESRFSELEKKFETIHSSINDINDKFNVLFEDSECLN